MEIENEYGIEKDVFNEAVRLHGEYMKHAKDELENEYSISPYSIHRIIEENDMCSEPVSSAIALAIVGYAEAMPHPDCDLALAVNEIIIHSHARVIKYAKAFIEQKLGKEEAEAFDELAWEHASKKPSDWYFEQEPKQ